MPSLKQIQKFRRIVGSMMKKGDPMRRQGSLGKDILFKLVDRNDLLALEGLLAEDRQSKDLLREIKIKLIEELEPKEQRVEFALNRLKNLIYTSRGQRDPDNLRNQIFKIADELGIRLPSGLF